MKTRRFYTTGNRDIIEDEWDKPEPTDTQLEVKAVITGVCRSDIDMYIGEFPMLPPEIQGHEGIGLVTKVGKDAGCISVGDLVATRGEPAFSDYYNVNIDEYVPIPEADPKYIIEPIACGLNLMGPEKNPTDTLNGFLTMTLQTVGGQHWDASASKKEKKNILILGTGFLATTLFVGIVNSRSFGKCDITVVGNANTEFWMRQNVTFLQSINDVPEYAKFDVVFDITSRPSYTDFAVNKLNDAGIIVMASEKKPNVPLPIQELLWKSAQIVFPSPRSTGFIHAMRKAVDMIQYDNVLDTSKLWTQGYDRDTEVKQAFEDGLNRPEGYSRGYIRW